MIKIYEKYISNHLLFGLFGSKNTHMLFFFSNLLIKPIPGRGKMKKMMSMMMMGGAMKLIALMPLAIAGLFILAGKALITAKVTKSLFIINKRTT